MKPQWTVAEINKLVRAAEAYERQWRLIQAIEFPHRTVGSLSEKSKTMVYVEGTTDLPLRIETEPQEVAAIIHPMVAKSRARMPMCLAQHEPDKVIEYSTASGERVVESPKSPRIKTVDDLIREMKIDLDEWDIKQATCNKWEMGAAEKATGGGGMSWKREKAHIIIEPLFQVKLILVPKNPLGRMLNAFGAKLCQRLTEQPVTIAPATHGGFSGNQYMLELALVDHHFGKYCRARETGHGDYDLPIARDLWRAAVTRLIESTTKAFEPRKIVMPFGNDASHFDTKMATTTGGTPMDAAGRYFEVYEEIVASHIWAIEQALHVAPIELLWVPGNHDYLTSFHLGQLLKAKFESNPHVNVNIEPTPRKYTEWGINLLGFTHGSEEKMDSLPISMAKEAREMWSRTTSWEWHIGHTHKMRILGESYAGVRIRTLPTLTSHDHWHNLKGYMDRRAAEAYVWGSEEGYAGHFSFNVNPS